MPVNHHVLLRFNLNASKEACLFSAKFIGLDQDIIKKISSENDQHKVCDILYSAVLYKICELKDIINREQESNIIFEAKWSKNISTIPEDKFLTEQHGVNYKIEMLMADKSAVEKYFYHPAHENLVKKFKELEKMPNSIFLKDGFAIPFDTKQPLTPRTIRDLAISSKKLPFNDSEATCKWALPFVNQFRPGGFSRNDDLRVTASAIEKTNPNIAKGIINALNPN